MGVEGTLVDAAVGWLVQSILGSLLTDKLEAWAREVGLTDDARRLEREMRGVEAVLAAARGRVLVSRNEALAQSMEELRDLLYDAEDVLDELDYYRLQREIQQGAAPATGTSTDRSIVSSVNDIATSSTSRLVWNARDSFTSWASKAIDSVMIHTGRKRKRVEEWPAEDIIMPLENKHDMSRRMNEIASQLCIVGDSVEKALHLEMSYCIAAPREGAVSIRPLTTSIPVEQKVYGRDTDRDKIVELLINGKSSDPHVLPVVGNGGVGKTTLARFVYRDQRIRDHFDLQMWVCVSNNFDEVCLTREMLEHIYKDRKDFNKISSFNVLQELLADNIRSRRFLLVVDDVCDNKETNFWSRLFAPLKCSEVMGCMILATTRSPSVAKMIGTQSTLELKGLDDDDFWLFFKSCAFGDENHGYHPNLQAIGKQIVKTLKGNPLAAQSVGALLRQDLTCEHWYKVQEQWTTLQKGSDSILPILKFSYDHLPFYLQRCFSYCSLFPEDYKFNGERLVRAWISQSFVYCKDTSNTIEETGKQYLDRLVDLGFFQKDGSHYIMHDLMHELAKMVSSNEYATIDGLNSNTTPQKIRHLSIIWYAYHEAEQIFLNLKKFERELQKIGSLEKLRTLMFFGYGCRNLLKYFQTLCRDAKSLRYIRIHLSDVEIDSLWNSIKPFHVRCIEFSIRGIETDHYYWCSREKELFGRTAYAKVLPMFYHLHTLDASHINLVVPSHISNLVNLRHLIAGEETYSKIANIGKMTSLKELKGFRVQNAYGFEIGQLQSMNGLVTLRISQLENVSCKEEATGARLADKEQLEDLCLLWNGNATRFKPTTNTVVEAVLEGLRPNRNIKHIQIRGFNGCVCPTWLMTNSSVTSLCSLHLENCNQWRRIQLENITSLGTLKLIKMWSIVDVSVPSLEELLLIELPNLERCVGTYKKDLSSHLRILRMERCGKLKDFTLFQNYDCFKIGQKTMFPFLNKLNIKHCPQIMQWTTLPFEEMQSLEELELIEMPSVIHLSVPCLKKLILIQLPNLECCTSLNEHQLSDSIEVLQIVKCSKLFHFPVLQVSLSQDEKEWLPNAYELTVHDCPHLMVSCPLPPSTKCSKVSVSIRGVSAPPAMEMMKDLSSFTIQSEELSILDEKVLAFHNLTSILNFDIVSCPNLVSVSFQVFRKLVSLERMEINDCPKLLSPRMMLDEIYNDNDTMRLHTPFARYLTIKSSGMMGELLLPCVQSLELTIKDCWKITSVPFICPVEEQSRRLSLLYISSTITSTKTALTRDEQVLLKIPHPLYTSVKKLYISNCPGLVLCNREEGFSTFAFLEVLTVTGCSELLMSVVHEDNIHQRCLLPPSLNQFEATHLPPRLQPYFPGNHTSLRRLTVWDSPRLESLQLHFCTNLEEIEIFNCQNLSALGGLPYLNSLKILKLERNLKLSVVTLEPSYHDQESWEDQNGGHNLYPRLEWIETDDVSLLTMSFCKHITALQHFTLSSSISHNGMTRLSEEQLRALQELTSLKELRFVCFYDLLSLPAVLYCLPSLKKLEIVYCPSISRLPEEGLPLASMEELEIRGCSEELCKQCRLTATSKLRVIIDGEVVDDLTA